MTIIERPARTPLSVVVLRLALLLQLLAVLVGCCLAATFTGAAFAWADPGERTAQIVGLLVLFGLGLLLAVALITALARLRARRTRGRLIVLQAVLLLGSLGYALLVPDAVGLGTTPDVPTVLGGTAAVALLALVAPSSRAQGDPAAR